MFCDRFFISLYKGSSLIASGRVPNAKRNLIIFSDFPQKCLFDTELGHKNTPFRLLKQQKLIDNLQFIANLDKILEGVLWGLHDVRYCDVPYNRFFYCL